MTCYITLKKKAHNFSETNFPFIKLHVIFQKTKPCFSFLSEWSLFLLGQLRH
jgi:hypothetical protein